MPDLNLSVVLCTYNGEAFLREQLSSLLSQSRLPDEIIIGDDGSTDASWDILEAFVPEARSRHIDVQLIRQPVNLGYVKNFASMLRLAKGDVLFLCDQDDIWSADKLEVMAGRFRTDPSLMLLHSDARLIDDSAASLPYGLFESIALTDSERNGIRRGDGFAVFLRRNIVTGATAALRRTVVERALPIGEGWVHDAWLALVAAVLGRVDFLDEPLIDYRQHGGNQIGSRKRSLKMKVNDMLCSHAASIREKEASLGLFADHLRTLEPRPLHQIERVLDMQTHYQVRLQIGGWRAGRLMPILRELCNGRYRLYGTGWFTAMRDLLRRD